MQKIFALLIAFALVGCVTTPTGGQQLSETGKVALQAISEIAVRHYIQDHPGRQTDIIANVRHIAAELQSLTTETTVSGLRIKVEAEVLKLPLSAADRQDAVSLLNIFEALLKEQVGSDVIDGKALVKVNEFLTMVLNALPAS